MPKVACPKTGPVAGADVTAVEIGCPNTLCPKEDPKELTALLVGWPNSEVPTFPVIVAGRPKRVVGAAATGVVLLSGVAVVVVATCAGVDVSVVGMGTTLLGLLWPNKDVKLVFEVVVTGVDEDWPKSGAIAGVVEETTDPSGA